MPPMTALRGALAFVLALAVPGAGHVFLGRRAKGLALLACLLAMFGLGVRMQARLGLSWGLDDVLTIVVGLAQTAIGLPYILARAAGLGEGDVRAVTFDYGNTFTAAAGLLNVLVALDAWDTALGRRG